MNEATLKTPVHLWVVAIVSLLWNLMGAFDYSATQMRLESYMSQFTPEQLEYFHGFPAWVDALWAIAVWCGLLGSIALLLRKSWATWLFGLSIVGMIGTTIHNFVLTDGLAAMGPAAGVFTVLIWAIALFLFFYSRAMSARKVLR